jgi:hypothetical protein
MALRQFWLKVLLTFAIWSALLLIGALLGLL